MQTKKLLITQSNYIPWKGYFDAINTVDLFVIYDDMQYTKRDWRNRNVIKTPQGTLWLSIPVQVKGKYLQKINETIVSDNTWREKHWRTIEHNYAKAPYFEQYREIFRALYLDSSEENLSKINYSFLQAICKILEIKTTFVWSSEFTLAEDRNERLLNICKSTGATDYYSGPAARAYMDQEMFSSAGVNVHYFDNEGYPEYRQLYGDFDHYVSMLDLLFIEGPHARQFMKSFQ